MGMRVVVTCLGVSVHVHGHAVGVGVEVGVCMCTRTRTYGLTLLYPLVTNALALAYNSAIECRSWAWARLVVLFLLLPFS